MSCEYVLYYDTQIDVDRCRTAYDLWKTNRAGRENLLWVKDLRDDTTGVRNEHPDAPLPILKILAMPFVPGWFGDDAVQKMRELYAVPSGIPEAVLLPPSIAAPLTPRVSPRYVLYTNDISSNIKVPGNGIVNVQSFDLISTTIGAKMPNWLLKKRALPVLATLEESPTVWYGQAAKDYCIMLSAFNGGLMII